MVSRPNSPLMDKRSAPRIPAAKIPAITGLRLTPHDVVATLVNISVSGVLVECESRSIPGSAVVVHFEGTFSPSSVRGRVARTSVASLATDGGFRYVVGIAFDEAISLDQPPSPQTVTPEPSPVAGNLSAAVENRW